MKTKTLLFTAVMLFILQSCINNCPPEPLTNNDIAGYIDGSTGLLFTTSEDRVEVLNNLQATPHKGNTYKMPVFEIENNQVYMLFEVAEVEVPAQFINYHFSDYCYGEIFIDFENELMEIIDLNEENLEDQFIIACGDAIGRLGDKENDKEKNQKGKEEEALKNLKEKKKNKKELKKEMSGKAKEKGVQAKDALNNDDKEGAKEKAKELVDEAKYKFYLKYKYDFCNEWELKLDYGKYWIEPPTVMPPELFYEFSKDNIRYKVFKSAKCGESFTPPYFSCWKFTSFDTINPGPAVWNTTQELPRKNCERGTGFCVEQEVVISLDKDYSDSLCSRLINVRPIKGFACFD